MTKIERQPYSPERIEVLLNYLKKYAEKGKALDYKIMVNHSEVVPRTNDPEDFVIYEGFLDGTTKWIEVVVYTALRTCTHHIFSIDDSAVDQEYSKGKNDSLSGIEVEEKIQSELQKERKKWEEELERKNILKENADLKEELEEKEKEYDELQAEFEALEQELEELHKRLSPLNGVLGDAAAQTLESLIKRNIDKVKDIPVVGGALAGFFGETPPQLPQGNPEKEPEGEVRVQMTVDESKLKDFAHDEVITFLLYECNKLLTKEQYEHVLLVVEKLRLHPSNIDTVLELLKDENDQNYENVHI